jgi:hypothetical protein
MVKKPLQKKKEAPHQDLIFSIKTSAALRASLTTLT